MGVYEAPPHPPALHDDPVDSLAQTLSVTHFPSEQAGPSTIRDYAPSLNYSYDSQTFSALEEASVVSPPTSSSTSSRYNSSQLDGENDINYSPPSDEDEEYRPPRAKTSQRKRKARSHSHRRPRPYGHPIRSRNFQREDGARLISSVSDFQCPVEGCGYIQRNQRIPDLERHIRTHERSQDPEKWICCGVGMGIAHLYGQGIEAGMSNEEHIEAGAYNFRGRLMIGGCLETFARRDSLKRHLDNPNSSCVGDMDSYPY